VRRRKQQEGERTKRSERRREVKKEKKWEKFVNKEIFRKNKR
jgi:hypothetical protein